jgi:hypothetical protein
MFLGAYDPNRITLRGVLHPEDGIIFSSPLEDSLATRRITIEGVGKNISLLKAELALLSGNPSASVPHGEWSRLYPLGTPGYIIYFESEDPIATGLRLLDTVLVRDLMSMRNLALWRHPLLTVTRNGSTIIERRLDIEANPTGRLIEPSIVF